MLFCSNFKIFNKKIGCGMSRFRLNQLGNQKGDEYMGWLTNLWNPKRQTASPTPTVETYVGAADDSVMTYNDKSITFSGD